MLLIIFIIALVHDISAKLDNLSLQNSLSAEILPTATIMSATAAAGSSGGDGVASKKPRLNTQPRPSLRDKIHGWCVADRKERAYKKKRMLGAQSWLRESLHPTITKGKSYLNNLKWIGPVFAALFILWKLAGFMVPAIVHSLETAESAALGTQMQQQAFQMSQGWWHMSFQPPPSIPTNWPETEGTTRPHLIGSLPLNLNQHPSRLNAGWAAPLPGGPLVGPNNISEFMSNFSTIFMNVTPIFVWYGWYTHIVASIGNETSTSSTDWLGRLHGDGTSFAKNLLP